MASKSLIDSQQGLAQIQHKYFNISVIGAAPPSSNVSTSTTCSYSQQFAGPIIDKCEEWLFGVVRFNVPMFNVPIFTDPAFDTPSNPAIISWYNSTFFPNGLFSTIRVNNTAAGNNGYVVDPNNPSFVYTIQSWVDAIQFSLNELTAAATTAGSTALGGVPLVPPLVTFSASTQLISITAQGGVFYPCTTGSGVINMYLNGEAYRFLPSLPMENPTYTDARQFARVRLGNPSDVQRSWNISEAIPALNPAAVSASVGSLNVALVAGAATTKLSFPGNVAYSVVPGQALFLFDSVSGNSQTVFVGSLLCSGITSIYTLLFTPVFSFPTTTTTVYLMAYQAVPLGTTPSPALMPVGSSIVLSQKGAGTGNNQTLVTTGLPYAAPGGPGSACWVPVQPFYPNFAYAFGSAMVYTTGLAPYDTITTETPVPPTWTSISTFRMLTTLIPTVPEFSPQISGPGVDPRDIASKQMVTDFVVGSTGLAVTRDMLAFVTDQPRWMDMIGTQSLSRLDVTVVWVDLKGVEHQVYLNQGERFEMKFAFKRKYTQCRSGF